MCIDENAAILCLGMLFLFLPLPCAFFHLQYFFLDSFKAVKRQQHPFGWHYSTVLDRLTLGLGNVQCLTPSRLFSLVTLLFGSDSNLIFSHQQS